MGGLFLTNIDEETFFLPMATVIMGSGHWLASFLTSITRLFYFIFRLKERHHKDVGVCNRWCAALY